MQRYIYRHVRKLPLRAMKIGAGARAVAGSASAAAVVVLASDTRQSSHQIRVTCHAAHHVGERWRRCGARVAYGDRLLAVGDVRDFKLLSWHQRGERPQASQACPFCLGGHARGLWHRQVVKVAKPLRANIFGCLTAVIEQHLQALLVLQQQIYTLAVARVLVE